MSEERNGWVMLHAGGHAFMVVGRSVGDIREDTFSGGWLVWQPNTPLAEVATEAEARAAVEAAALAEHEALGAALGIRHVVCGTCGGKGVLVDAFATPISRTCPDCINGVRRVREVRL